MSNKVDIPALKPGDKIFRVERYNHENKVYEYKIIHIEQNRIDGETTNIYYAKCEELVGYATENLLFFEECICKTVFLSEGCAIRAVEK